MEEHLANILDGDAGRELSLEDVLSKLKFEAQQHDPAEKVGQTFQYVERMMEKHGATGLFPDKKVAKLLKHKKLLFAIWK